MVNAPTEITTLQVILLIIQVTGIIINLVLFIFRPKRRPDSDHLILSFLFSGLGCGIFVLYLSLVLPFVDSRLAKTHPDLYLFVFLMSAICYLVSDIFFVADKISKFKRK